MIRQYAAAWAQQPLWAMPVVVETYDGLCNHIDGQHITEAHALAALDAAAGGPVAEGNVGGGNGMHCYGFTGGTGTSSLRVSIEAQGFTVAALVQANHGAREDFTVLGVPVGQYLPRQGTCGGNSSGHISWALSTANPGPLPQFGPAISSLAHVNDEHCDALYRAAVQSTEEAIINAMLAAHDALENGRGKGICRALDAAELLRVMEAHRFQS